MLKRTVDAARENHCIFGVLQGSAVLQDGKSASLTAPNGLAQEQVYRAALSDAGIDAVDVKFVEAHGTGTNLGDPVEVQSLVSVYGTKSGRKASNPLYVSGIKANIGHLEAGA
eukprot:gene3479-4321_t